MEKTATNVATEVMYKKKNGGLNHITERFYAFTNEGLNEYSSHFKDKPSMLSITASGDQIFTAILNGTTSVDALDINRYAKYYFILKKAAFLSLTREEFIDMFIMGKDCSYNQIDRIIRHLDRDSINFWAQALMDWHYYYEKSGLFHNYTPAQIFARNPYLKSDKYYELGDRLKDTEIDLRDGSLLALAGSYKKKYDLIYLSNVLDYYRYDYCEEILGKLKLSPNGCLVAYSFWYFPSHLTNMGFEIEEISTEHEVLIKRGESR